MKSQVSVAEPSLASERIESLTWTNSLSCSMRSLRFAC
jgi:hypothetical protein